LTQIGAGKDNWSKTKIQKRENLRRVLHVR